MQRDKRVVLSSLFLLIITDIVQCAPADKPSMYDTLVELTTNKCTYLQNTTLLRDDLQFLHDCGGLNSKLTADVKSLYKLEELHCLLYYDTFNALCMQAQEDVVKKLISPATVNSAGTTPLEGVCNDLHRFYLPNNHSQLGNLLMKPGKCERLCQDIEDNVMKACSYSALMSNVISQLVGQKVMPKLEMTGEVKILNIDTSAKMASNSEDPALKVVLNSGPEQETSQQQPNAKKLGVAQETSEKQPILENPAVKMDNKLNVGSPQGSSKEVDTNLPVANVPEKSTKPAASKAMPKTTEHVSESDQKTPNEQTVDMTNILKPSKPEVNVSGRTAEEQSSNALGKSTIMQSDQKSPVTSPIPKVLEKTDEEGIPMAYDEEDREVMPVEETEPPVLTLKGGKPLQTSKDEEFSRVSITNDDLNSNDSYFFSYFMMFCILFAMGYIGYHNKQKILALVLEGRRGRRQPRRRPNSANYHKLDSNLEEAVTSSCDKTTSNVIY